MRKGHRTIAPQRDANEPRGHASRESLAAFVFAIVLITVGFVAQAWRRGYGDPWYLLQADYLISLFASAALSVALMWRWRRKLGWFQLALVPVLTYTLLSLIALVGRSHAMP
jgi:hypothetical protein